MPDHSYALKDDIEKPVTFHELKEGLLSNDHNFDYEVVSFVHEESLYCQSKDFYQGIPRFVLVIHKDLKFEAYNHGVRTTVPTLSKKRITRLDKWSNLKKVLEFLSTMDIDHKKNV